MFRKILIANRGEIAVRIMKACKDMNVATVAVYSEADRESLHVKMADEAYCIGPTASRDSYLNISNLMAVAISAGADAVHPGYGFLAENAEFAEICAAFDIAFIGPHPEAIRKMGDKAVAKATMKKAGVPVVPGTDGLIDDLEEAVRIASEIGYPIIVKATAGGGGKGMRVAYDEEQLRDAIRQAREEADSAFGDSGVYLEKYLEATRHVEIQIMADKLGNTAYLGERDCSIQRRHQKLVEEAPSPALDGSLREQMGAAAIAAANAVNYYSVGTVEFLLDRHGRFYFMEMNTRIQVEHPVTELVTGVDLIKEQIAVAAGCPLSFDQEEMNINGWAIECRINAENPARHFMPSPGKVTAYSPPRGYGIRVDSALYTGCRVSPFYDSMVAKVIVWGRDRREAIGRMKKALGDLVIEGIETTIPFQLKLLEHESFVKGNFDTAFLETCNISLEN